MYFNIGKPGYGHLNHGSKLRSTNSVAITVAPIQVDLDKNIQPVSNQVFVTIF